MLTNEQRYALATRLVSIVERLVLAKNTQASQGDTSDLQQAKTREEIEQESLDRSLSDFVSSVFTRGPEDLFPQAPSAENSEEEGDEA